MDHQNDDGPDRCPLCDTDCEVYKKKRFTEIDCRVCGRFHLTGGGARSLRSAGAPYRSAEPAPSRVGDKSENRIKSMRLGAGDGTKSSDYELVAFLSCHTRQENEAGRVASVTAANWRDLAHRHIGTSPRENLEKLLWAVAKKAPPGKWAQLKLKDDATLIDCSDHDRFAWFIDALQGQEVIDVQRASGNYHARLTPAGWSFLDPLQRDQIEPGRVFVAMSFQEPRELEDAITGAIKAAGGHAEVVRNPKDGKKNQEITERIRSEIVRAEVVLADCSGHRPNVYFEIGYAMGLGRHVVLTCRQEDWDREQHFDTHHYPHLLWKDYEELRNELPDWLRPRLAQKAPGSGS